MPEIVYAPSVAPRDLSGTITAGASAQDLAVANSSRRGFWIQNNSAGDLWVNEIGGTAAASQPAIRIPPNGVWSMDITGVSLAKISIYGATTGQAFSAREWTD